MEVRKFIETKHKTDLEKLIISKRIILVNEAQELLDRKDITCTVNALVNDGKIKCKSLNAKINDKIRSVKVLYKTNIKRSEMKKFEEQLLENTFEAEENIQQVQKKPKSPTKPTQPETTSDLPKYTVINGKGGVLIRMHKGNSVVNRDDIMTFHEKETNIISDLINGNLHKLKRDIDYFVEQELLFTKNGYLMLTESLNDKKSLKVKNEMIKSYFKYSNIIFEESEQKYVKEEQEVYTNNAEGFAKLLVGQLRSQNERLNMLEKFLSSLGLQPPTLPPIMN